MSPTCRWVSHLPAGRVVEGKDITLKFKPQEKTKYYKHSECLCMCVCHRCLSVLIMTEPHPSVVCSWVCWCRYRAGPCSECVQIRIWIQKNNIRSLTYSCSKFCTIPTVMLHEFECEADAAGNPVCSKWLEGCFHCHSLPCPLFNRPNGLFRSSVLQSILPERKNPTPKDTLFPTADERWHISHSKHHPVVPE